MKTVYFVRHGQSEASAAKRLGSRSATPLTKLGQLQVHDGALAAKEAGLVVDLMLVSPLERARQSADIIADVLHPNKVEIFEPITVQDLGPYENESYAEYENFLEFEESLLGKPGVESIAEMHERAVATIEFIQKRTEDTILLVSHGSFAPILFDILGSTLVRRDSPMANGQIVRIL